MTNKYKKIHHLIEEFMFSVFIFIVTAGTWMISILLVLFLFWPNFWPYPPPEFLLPFMIVTGIFIWLGWVDTLLLKKLKFILKVIRVKIWN